MTREKIKELLPVLQAYAEGKTIQIRDTMGHNWIDNMEYNNLQFDLDPSRYRIKPEDSIVKNEEEQYRLFKNCSELINICGTKLIWVKHKRYGSENLITAFDNDPEIGGSCVFVQDMWIDMKELFNNFTFLDGSPCGVKE